MYVRDLLAVVDKSVRIMIIRHDEIAIDTKRAHPRMIIYEPYDIKSIYYCGRIMVLSLGK